jgi:hypothetical protein
MPNKLQASIGTASAAQWARCSTAVFPKMFTFKEKVPSVLKNYHVTPSPLRAASPPHFATVYNKLTGGGDCWCVSIQAPSLPGPSW